MKQSTFLASNSSLVARLTTEEVAVALRVTPQTIRASLCRNSHYQGLKPVKLPNRKLLWDATAVEALLAGGR